MKQRCSKALLERVKAACEKDSAIIVDRAGLDATQGFGLDHFEYLGLSKQDLKRLARTGLAMRAYTKNVWLPGEIMPSGRPAPGQMVEIPWVEKSTAVDERGYTRSSKKVATITAPLSTMRGSGHRTRWILVAQE